MFSLIITLIALVLVAALVVVGLWYGGGLFRDGQLRAQAAQLIQEGGQVRGAAQAYASSEGMGSYAASIEDLKVAGYLREPPPGWEVAQEYVYKDGVSLDVCFEANRMVGYPFIPVCGSPEHLKEVPCCSSAP